MALVTGGDSGIGRAVCYCFAMEGATVAFTYVKSQEDKDAEDTLRMLREIKKGDDAKDPIAIPADLGFEENCRKVVEKVAGTYGRIDILVNNSAEQYVNTCITDITEEQLERVFRTNIFSYFLTTKSSSNSLSLLLSSSIVVVITEIIYIYIYKLPDCCRHAVKYMKEGSIIINTSSVNAYKGNAKLLDYTATKGAVVGFTRGLALQLAEKGIRVNGVAPGPVWTPLIPASMPEEMVANFGKEVPLGRPGQPHEIAPSYVFLASSQDSSYITGQVIHANGTYRRPVLRSRCMRVCWVGSNLNLINLWFIYNMLLGYIL